MTKTEAREVGLSVGPSWIAYTPSDHYESHYPGLYSLTVTPVVPGISANAKKTVFYYDVGTAPLGDLPMYTTFNVVVVAHNVNGWNTNITILCTTVKTCELHSFCYTHFDHVLIIWLFCSLGGPTWSTDLDESAVTLNWDIDDPSFANTSLETVLLCEMDVFQINAPANTRFAETCHSIPAKHGNRRFEYDRTGTAKMFFLKALRVGDELETIVHGSPLYVGIQEHVGDYGVQRCKSHTPFEHNWHQSEPEVKPFCLAV